MADQQKFKQFIDELQKAVEQGNLPRDILSFAERMLIVGGNMINSQAVVGDGNVINVYPPAPIEEKAETNESALLTNALAAYHNEQVSLKNKTAKKPYPGLSAYRIQDAGHFFGRGQAIAELLPELESKQVTWLHGRSGTGKSSLIQAGLMPALLEKKALPILVRSFDESPTTALKKAVLKRNWSEDLKLSKKSLLQFLSNIDDVLKGKQLYIFFDQFEEFFTQLPEVQQDEFARELADCIADTSLPVHFIFSLRGDYFGETAILRRRLQTGVGYEYPVRLLTADEARQVIINPLEQLGITYQDGLVDTILKHLGAGNVDSPQVQLVCEKLFRTLPENNKQITFEHYQKLGETKGILTDYLKNALHDQQAIPSDQFKAATYILSTLVTPDGKRGRKKASDWYADERIRLLTLNWHVDKGLLPPRDNAFAIQTTSPVTVAKFIEDVRSHVSAQGEDLRQFVNNMLSRYESDAQRSLVDDVIKSLRDARLLHEIQSDSGERSYELIHDYLVAEVMSWLDEDEQNALQLQNKLEQKRKDFEQHKLLIEPKELEIISSQLGNPKLALKDSQKHLLLLSAAAQGIGQQWLKVSGIKGLAWLREACLTDEFPDNVRLGAATCLGAADDETGFDNLQVKSQTEKDKAKRSSLLDLLANYLHHTSIPHSLSSPLAWQVFLRQAKLRVKDGVQIRSRMRKIAAYTASICALIMMVFAFMQSILSPTIKTPAINYLLITLFFVPVGFFGSYFFSDLTISLMLIIRRWFWGWQAVILSVIGAVLGSILLYLLSGQVATWFLGGIISLTPLLAKSRSGFKSNLYSAATASIIGVLVFTLCQITIKDLPLEKFGSVISPTIFAVVYTYFAANET